MSTDLVGRENLPNVYIKNISIEESGPNLVIGSTIHLYDVPSGGWYSEEQLKTNMKILVALSTNENFNSSVVTGRGSLTPDHIRKITGYNEDEVMFKTFSIDQVNRAAFENQLDNGHIVFPYKCSFTIPESQNVSMFAVCYLDVKQFSTQNSLELSTTNVSSYHGAIVGELVLVDGQTALESRMFVNEQGNPYIGPVHSHTSGVMEGSKHSSVPHQRLTLQVTKNIKIKDYRMPFKTKMRNKMHMKRLPIFSNLYPNISNSGNLSATFDINIEQLYMQTSAYAKVLRSLDPAMYDKAIENFKIQKISILKQKVVEKVSSSKIGTKKVHTKPYGSRIEIVSTKEDPAGYGLLSVNTPEGTNPMASIAEFEVNYGPRHTIRRKQKYRTVCFKEHNGVFSKGKVVYSVELSYKDPSEEIIQHLMKRSKEGLSTLKNYKTRVERRTNYNYYADETKSNLYNSDTASAFYLKPITAFMSMYNLMFDISDQDEERLVSNLVVMVHPRTATIKSLGWFYEKYSFMYNRLSKYFNNLNVSLTPTLKLGYVQGDTNKGKVTITNTFEQVVDFSDFKTSVSIIPLSVTGRVGENQVFPILSYSDFRATVRTERLKFFRSEAAFTEDTVPFLKSDYIANLNNLDYNSYTCFSPSNISRGQNNTIDLSIMESIDVKKFSNIFNEDTNNDSYKVGYKPRSRRQHNVLTGRKKPFYIKVDKRPQEDLEEYRPASQELGIDSQFVNNNEQDVKLDSPNVNKNVKDRFKSYSKSKQGNFKISIKDYNLRNENNILSNLANQQVSEAAKRRTFRDIPLQLKALMGSEYGFTKNNLFYAQGDAMKDSTIKDIIKTCFLSLTKVQYLEEYNGDNLKNHVWRDMTSYSFNSLIVRGKKTVLCKIVPFESNSLKVEADFFDRVGIENQYFFISPRSNRETIAPTIIRKPALDSVEVGPQAANDDNEPSAGTLQIMQNFIAQAPTLNDTTPPVACKTLVITQPNSKDGPLRDVDYKVTSGLTGVATGGTSPSPRPMTGTTMTTAPAVATTPTMSPAAGGGSSSGGSY